MNSSYSIRSAFQRVESIENMSMKKVENSQDVLLRAQLQIFIQKDIMQISFETTDNIITSIITDFSNLSISNFIDVLQSEIDEIAKRSRIVTFQKILRKTRIDEAVDFRSSVMFDWIMILSIRPEENAELNLEKLYRMVDPKRYSEKSQQDLERFLLECAQASQVKSHTYKKD